MARLRSPKVLLAASCAVVGITIVYSGRLLGAVYTSLLAEAGHDVCEI